MQINTSRNRRSKIFSIIKDRRQTLQREREKKQSPKYFENETPLGFSVNLIKFLFIAEKLSTFKS